MEDTAHEGWTRYHITSSSRGWRFFREGAKRAIKKDRDRNAVIKEALYYMADNGGLLIVHKRDATVDFIVDNWVG